MMRKDKRNVFAIPPQLTTRTMASLALDLLVDELRRGMCLLGTTNITSIGPEHMRPGVS